MLIEGLKGVLGDDQRRSVLAIDRQADKLVHLVGELDNVEASTSVDPNAHSGVFTSPSLAAPSVLVADDDEDILVILGELLGDRYQLTFAHD